MWKGGALQLWDRILPDQAFNRLYYDGPEEEIHERIYGLLARASGVRPPAVEFDLEQSDVVPLEEMASNPLGLRFLELLVRISGARRVLEIGAYIGLSSMHMARALPPGGRLVSIEKFDRFADICRRNFARNGLADRIELCLGDAWAVLRERTDLAPLDLVFIDGDKERYADYFLLVEPLVRPGGLVVVDDVLFQGDALNAEPRTAKGAGVVRLLEVIGKKSDWLRSGLPLCDGMLLLAKPNGPPRA